MSSVGSLAMFPSKEVFKTAAFKGRLRAIFSMLTGGLVMR